MNPDYHSYTSEELEDVCSNIDKDRHPERYQNILNELSTRRLSEQDRNVDIAPKATEPKPKSKKKRSKKQKITSSLAIFIAVAAFIFYGKIPGRHGDLTAEGEPYFFWITIAILVSLAINNLLTIKWSVKSQDKQGQDKQGHALKEKITHK